MSFPGNFNPPWGYVAPTPGLLRLIRIVIVAAAVGACGGVALALALTNRVTAGEEAVAARTLMMPSVAAITAPAHETHSFVDASPPPKKGQVAAKKGHMNPSQHARRSVAWLRSLDEFFAR